MAHFVAGLLDGLRAHPDVAVLPYLLSWRSRFSGSAGAGASMGTMAGGAIRLPLPAGVALRLWSRLDRPTVDRWIARGPRPARVVHATNFLAPPLRRGGTVVTVHDCAFLRSPDLASSAVRRFAPALARAIRRGAWVHTPSRHVAGEVAERFSTERVVPVPSGIPALDAAALNAAALDAAALDAAALDAALATGAGCPPAPALPSFGSAPFVLALGTLEPRKNHARLVAAFGEVAATEPELRLVLAGPDGPARPAVEAAIGRLPGSVRHRVRILGQVDEATRSQLLRAAAVLAYPSLDEGFGFPVLEAMAVGTPVLAAAAGAIPEVAGDAALLVEPTDPRAIADALTALLGDTELRRRLVEAGRMQAAQFSWEATAAGLAALYRRAAAG